MSILLEEVLLNHDPADKRGSALNLRVDAELPLLLPEWQLQADGSVRRAPAAYAARTISPALLRVGARLRWLGAPLATVEVRALIGSAAGSTNSVPVLGELAARRVQFGSDGDSGRVLFAVRGGWLSSAPVGVHRIAWRWQYRINAERPWSDFAVSDHQVFTTLLAPSAPWSAAPFVDANIALLWSDVLEFACTWAAGAVTTSEAATLITQRLFLLGGTRFEYGCPVFGREMYTSSVLALFDCSALIARLKGGEGNGRYVNCTDCACIISTLANALGARLWQSRMGLYAPAFLTRDIRVIGGAVWDSPCGLGLGFMFHEVAWSGNATEFDAVWDGSLLVNADLRPIAGLLPILAANLRFGAPFAGLYRSMIAQPQDQFICQPRPEERRCRALM